MSFEVALILVLHLVSKSSTFAIASPYPGKDAVLTSDEDRQCGNIREDYRFECVPGGAGQVDCENRGCCWEEVMSPHSSPAANTGHTVVPHCYYPYNYPGYTLSESSETETGFSLLLKRTTKSHLPKDVMNLKMDVMFETSTRLHIKISDDKLDRYEVPIRVPEVTEKAPYQQYEINYGNKPNFFFNVVRKNHNGKPLIDSALNSSAFIFADQFLQLSYLLPSKYIYGIGEHQDSLLHSTYWTKFVLWNKDRAVSEYDNSYGSHPFYLVMEEDGSSHGVFLMNSNAMEVLLQPAPAITWRTIGGILDFYIFTGPTPEAVTQQYHEVIGKAFMPPYWSLGFHLCRWGYKTANETLKIVESMRDAKIPQDVQWNDIDYMHKYLDFTSDAKVFGDQPKLVDALHQRGMHYVIITDPGISVEQREGSYPPYDLGKKMGIFINDSNNNIFIGKVWPGKTAWPDFTNPSTQSYWTKMIWDFHKTVPFDGLWIDMNEPSNFVSGAIDVGCPKNSTFEHPPYVPAVAGGKLSFSTLCATAKQQASLHYNVHSMYGLTETIATHNALINTRGKRPFIISRSTFPSQGHYGGHWTGDISATWLELHKSIIGVLDMNMFGIPMVGADICGFRGNTTKELCLRWHQLGAFYPFSRNHNNLGNRPQEPTAFGMEFAKTVRAALNARYDLIPYLYTLLFNSHQNGGTVMRPLFFEFPDDTVTYSIDTHFMWGGGLMIVPVLKQGATSVDAYFPKGLWYNFLTEELVNSSVPHYVNVQAPTNGIINIYVRGGYILPWQSHGLTTMESRKTPINLRVALNATMQAQGSLYWDDGESLDPLQSGDYLYVKYISCHNHLYSVMVHDGYSDIPKIQGLCVSGIPKAPVKCLVNGNAWPCTRWTIECLHLDDLLVDLHPLEIQWILM